MTSLLIRLRRANCGEDAICQSLVCTMASRRRLISDRLRYEYGPSASKAGLEADSRSAVHSLLRRDGECHARGTLGMEPGVRRAICARSLDLREWIVGAA